jgi:phosphonate transport system substrate-binding protein
MRSMTGLFWALALIGGLCASAAQAHDKSTFCFTIIPDDDESSHNVEPLTKMAEQLQAKLGVPVKFVPAITSSAATKAFTSNEVQLGWFGGFMGVRVRHQAPDSQALAQTAEDAAFRFYLIAHDKTGLKPSKDFPKEIAGKSFTFGGRTSTSGRLMPEYFIRQAFGRSPEEVFSRVGFSGDQSLTIQLVQAGAFEVGAVSSLVWNLDQKGRTKLGPVSAIWESPPFPHYQWTIRGDVDATFGTGFTERVRAALLSIDDPAILGVFGGSKFIPANNEAYEPIEEVAKINGHLP